MEKMAEGLFMLNISSLVMGRRDTVHPALVADAEGFMLIDTGYPGQWAQLKAEIEAAGAELSTIGRIAITHQDLDHIGSLPDAVREASPTVRVLAHELEKPHIQGNRKLLRFTPEAIAAIDAMPPQVPESFRMGLKRILEFPPTAEVHDLLTEDEQLSAGGGLIVIATPGHTPGHISLYHSASRTLIAGDALTASGGELCGPDPRSTLDMQEALRSLDKLSRFDIGTVLCYHGGICRGSMNERIALLAGASA